MISLIRSAIERGVTSSVAFEEVQSHEWLEKAYKADIQSNWDKLYKRPGYHVNDP